MRLYDGATVAWHMSFIASIYSSWDKPYAEKLLRRFNLNPDHKVKGLSRGQAVKTSLLLALAHHPRLLILDEPTTGLDPIVRQEVLAELMDVLLDEERSILMSSQNTQDVQQISDVIALIDGGAILEIDEKEAFLDRWRRLILEIDPKMSLPGQGGFHTLSRNGRTCVLTTGRYSDQMRTDLEAASANLIEVQPMTLEEIFLARIQIARKGAAL
jgi:ABC-2 type transport system ATP-binding protein